MQHRALFAALAAVVLVPALALAQQKAPRRQAPIEIRGQVPTPQVVTVRPREVPAYSRRVLVPEFFDHDFWPSILPAYQLVPSRVLTGRVPADSALYGRDSITTSLSNTTVPSAAVMNDVPADAKGAKPVPNGAPALVSPKTSDPSSGKSPAPASSTTPPAPPVPGTARARASR